MEPYVQTETYDLENGGSLVFERDLYLVSEKLERPPPQFHGVRIHNTPAGEQQWMITADLKGSSEPPISERILFSFKAYSWVDGLAHALQEGLARVCGQNIAALRGSRFAHFARHDTMGEPMALSSHPVLKIHVQHLDFMLHETRKDLELTRVHSHRAQMALAHHADAIRLLAKDRRSLRLQRAKNVATITRLREKIRTLEVTVRTQQDQIQEMEEDGEDIQGGDDFLSDDNDFEDDEFTDEEDYEFLELRRMGSFPSMWMKTMRNSCTSFTYVDREAERAERQANLAALQQIAQNNQGHGNHDHPGSKLKNFQNTNPPMFSKTEEPLDADDWLQTIENNLEVAGVEAAEKVLFATHYLSGPARAWWTSARAMNAGQMMTWEDFKLKFSKYHVPQGLIKKMRDEFRELKQGRMSVVEYRDRFLTLSSHNNNGNNTNTHTGQRTGSNAIPVAPKDKSTVNCDECGVVGHFSKECPKKLAKIAANTAAPAQQQRRFVGRRNQNNNNGRFYHMTATEAQEAPQTLTTFPTDQFHQTSPEQPQSQAHTRRSSQTIAIDWSSPEPRRGTRVFYTLDNLASTTALDRRRPPALSDPLPRRRSELLSPVDDDAPRSSDRALI
ncbi:hypothetical protein QYE76_003703 [Lolium multiflorum]|uniref:CCHC-type domain-containing protein n=1 Tax=Lolium multiflorum TaxID=4521 RepID=A0AAD8W1I4_LOLMU|nr:hypothetical protein QYE76_003703 [Lolium multiflorum]